MNWLINLLYMIKLFFKYSKLLVKSAFQYKFNAFLLSFAVFFREAGGIIVVYFTLSRVTSLNGWNLYKLLFLFSFLFLSYSLLILFFTGFRDFESLIRNGTFDSYLTRPLGTFFQIISSKADYFAAIGHGTLGILLFLWSSNKVGVTWNASSIIYVVLIIVGGVIIQASVFIIFSSSSFWTVKTTNLMNFAFYSTRKFAGYPISIYPSFIQKFLIYIVPFAFVNYFPTQFFLRKTDIVLYPSIFMYLTPLVGLVLLIIASFIWKYSLKRYSSTGS